MENIACSEGPVHGGCDGEMAMELGDQTVPNLQ